jgi:osmotically-inducible protein OsmY
MARWCAQDNLLVFRKSRCKEDAMRRDDKDIEAMVEHELDWDPAIHAEGVAVQVKDGVVTLAGFAKSYLDKSEAERIAKRVRGVKAVANDIGVDLPGASSRIDPDIAHDVILALGMAVPMTSKKLTAIVSDGWVTLEGDAEWDFQRRWAEAATRRVQGVKGVSNSIHLKPIVNAADLETKIEKAFERSALIEAGRIRVEADGAKVILRGRVRSWAEKDDAAKTAARAPGVIEVENRIEVDPALQSATQAESGLMESA